MAKMDASEAFEKLTQNIDISYYIGKPGAEAIAQACRPTAKKEVVKKGPSKKASAEG